jgi:sialic acid synthase SpsE
MVFLSTPFDMEAVDFLDKLGMPAFKIASSDLTNLPLIRRCADTGKPLLISTGMGTLEEAGAAIEAARMRDHGRIALLHCVSIYPTPAEAAQLDAIHEMIRLFEIPIGFSDHSLSPTLPVAAVALGARIIEKHFTLSRSLPGPDHAVALEPEEFAVMARGCREVVVSFAASAGKNLTPALENVRRASLRGLYARVDIPAGAVIGEEDLIPLRPAAELTISDLGAVVGRKARRAIARGEAIRRDSLE